MKTITEERDLQKICKNCGHSYGWHNELGFCCHMGCYKGKCWSLEK